MVIEADDSRDSPSGVLVLPQHDELRFADGLLVVRARMMEAMDANLHRAVIVQWIHLKSPWNKLAAHFSADIFLYAVHENLFADGQSRLIVIELEVVGDERAQLVEIATVGGIEERGVLPGDGTKELIGRRLCLRRLGAASGDRKSEQRQ